MSTKVLLLHGKNKNSRLLDFLKEDKSNKVSTSSKKLRLSEINNFDTIISYGYRFKIDEKLIKKNKNLINLHISFLPFNRGAHPNFWSFIENTPSGVSIHKIDKGIDTGDIINQKLIDFDILKNKKKLTFSYTYKKLINELENLFIENSKKIINNDYTCYKQIGKGSVHYKSQLPKILKTWNQNIFKTRLEYSLKKEKIISDKLKILDKIEETRKSNNVNWMNILRNGIKNSTNQTLDILKMINQDDKRISKLFKKLNEK